MSENMNATFKIPKLPKRLKDQDEEDNDFFNDGLTEDQRKMFDYIETAENVPEISAKSLKSMIAKVNSCFLKNQELRTKYLHSPEKFLESEVLLDQAINDLKALAAVPTLYVDACEYGLASAIINVFQHENFDIILTTVSLLTELTDEDLLAFEDIGSKIIAAMIYLVTELSANGFFEMLVMHCRKSSTESQESSERIFSLFENIATLDSSVADLMCEKCKIIELIMDTLQDQEFTQTRGSAAELLCILAQSSIQACQQLQNTDSITRLLQVLSLYQSYDPPDPLHLEYPMNLFTVLLAILKNEDALGCFRNCNGINQMLLFLKTGKLVRIPAIKVLAAATSSYYKEGKLCALHFIDANGLGVLGSLIMKKDQKHLKKTYKTEYSLREDMASVVSLIWHLLCALYSDIQYNNLDLLIDRFMRKITENSHEKFLELIKMYLEHFDNNLGSKEDEYIIKIEQGYSMVIDLACIIAKITIKNKEIQKLVESISLDLGLIENIIQTLKIQIDYAIPADASEINNLIEQLDVCASFDQL